jgi:hypothetical protein
MSDPADTPSSLTRRAFARDVSLAAAVVAVLPEVLAQTPPVPKPGEPPPLAPPTLSKESQAEVEARIQWVFTKYGSRLDAEQRADVRRLITGGQSGIDALRAFPLDNSVAPAGAFRVYSAKRGGGK